MKAWADRQRLGTDRRTDAGTNIERWKTALRPYLTSIHDMVPNTHVGICMLVRPGPVALSDTYTAVRVRLRLER